MKSRCCRCCLHGWAAVPWVGVAWQETSLRGCRQRPVWPHRGPGAAPVFAPSLRPLSLSARVGALAALAGGRHQRGPVGVCNGYGKDLQPDKNAGGLPGCGGLMPADSLGGRRVRRFGG